MKYICLSLACFECIFYSMTACNMWLFYLILELEADLQTNIHGLAILIFHFYSFANRVFCMLLCHLLIFFFKIKEMMMNG